MRIVLGLATVGMLLYPAGGSAQVVDRVPPGSRIRIAATGLFPQPTTATVTGWHGDSLLLELTGGFRRSVSRASILRLEVSRGRKPRVVTGAAIGLAVGAAATAVFLSGFCNDPDTRCEADEYVRAFTILSLPPAAAGALIGLFVRADHWETVRLAPPSAGTPVESPVGRQIGVGVALHW